MRKKAQPARLVRYPGVTLDREQSAIGQQDQWLTLSERLSTYQMRLEGFEADQARGLEVEGFEGFERPGLPAGENSAR